MIDDCTLDALAERLQRACDERAERKFGPALVARWRQMRHIGLMENPTAQGTVQGPRGETFTMTLRIESACIAEAKGFASGCGPNLVALDALCELIEGTSPTQARTIEAEHVLSACGGLPEDKRHCADLALAALRQALNAV